MNMTKRKFLFMACMILIFINGCNLNQYKYVNIKDYNYSIKYDKKIPISLEQKINSVFKPRLINGLENIYKIEIKNYKFNRYDIYSGQALRSLEVEVRSSIEIALEMNDKKVNKSLISMRRYNSNELNPMADQEMLNFIKNELIEDLVNQLMLEVNLIDM